NAIFRTRSGELVAFGHPHVPQHLDRGRFTTVHPTMPASVRGPGWGWYQIDLQDRFGGWWIASGNGVVRFPAVGRLEGLERTRAVEVLAWRGCFRGQDVFRVYEDSRSDLWIGTIEGTYPSLHRWNRTTGLIDCFATSSFLQRESAPTAFLDDGRGALWIG